MPDPSKVPLRVVGERDGGPEGGAFAQASRGAERGADVAPRYELDVIVAGLRASRDVTHNIRRGGQVRPPPSLPILGEVLDDLTAALFPSHHGPGELGAADFDPFVRGTLNGALCLLEDQIRRCSRFVGDDGASEEAREAEALAVTRAFSASLPAVRGALVADLRAARGDGPSPRSLAELLLADAGVSATAAYRLAHVLDGLGAPLPARLLSSVARRRTGIDIHPAAQIGPGLSVGLGTSVGESAVLGARVQLGGGVALGAGAEADGARGPVIGDDVTMGSGSTATGAARIGRGAVIGGGVCLTGSVPPGARVIQAENRRAGDAV